MADILILGMEMPKSCGFCELRYFDGDADFCPFVGDACKYGTRHDDCPLVEQGGETTLYLIFRWVYNTRKILDFTNVVTIELKDGCYVLKCLDKTTRYVNADEYKIICVELED